VQHSFPQKNPRPAGENKTPEAEIEAASPLSSTPEVLTPLSVAGACGKKRVAKVYQRALLQIPKVTITSYTNFHAGVTVRKQFSP
jgi:hypothetical protein